MKTNLNSALSCAVFGHNFRRPKHSTHHDELVCSSCQTKVISDSSGNFEELPSNNTEIHQTLRQLFVLNRRRKLRHISI